jgi:hypothetical protein
MRMLEGIPLALQTRVSQLVGAPVIPRRPEIEVERAPEDKDKEEKGLLWSRGVGQDKKQVSRGGRDAPADRSDRGEGRVINFLCRVKEGSQECARKDVHQELDVQERRHMFD